VSADAWARPGFESRIVLGGLILFLALAIGMSVTRIPWCDEVLFNSPALNLITKSHMGMSNVETAGSVAVGLDRYTYTTPPLFFLAQAAWYKLLGFGLFLMRATSLLWSLVVLAAFFRIVRKMTGEAHMALLAVILLGLDYTFLMGVSSGRPDMMSLALSLSAWASYLELRENHFSWAILVSHSLVAASGLTHPIGGLLSLLTILFLILYFDTRRIRWTHVGIAAIPYLVGGIGWGVYILQKPEYFIAQFTASVSGFDRAEGFKNPLINVWREPFRYLNYYGIRAGASPVILLKIALLPGYLLGFIGVLTSSTFRRRPQTRMLLYLALINGLGLALIDGSKLGVYLVHVIPWYLALLAAWLHWLWITRAVPRWLTVGALAALLMVQVGPVVYRIRLNTYHNEYLPAIAFIRQYWNPEARIMGPVDLGPGLDFSESLVEDTSLGYVSGKRFAMVVMDPRLQEHWVNFSRQKPAISAHVGEVMKDFRPAFQNQQYTVYLRQ
jgi:4-amino-4-deoxy-L-arabinose transferase-like glycosyltransferase